MSKKLKVLVFGGSFNPPTLAHEEIIAHCLALPEFNEVWVMPSGDRLDKTIAAADKDRLRMLEIIKAERFQNDPRLQISDFELQLPAPTQTHYTVKALPKAHNDLEFWYVFGDDAYRGMPNWPHGKDLQDKLGMVVFWSEPDEPAPRKNVIWARLDKGLWSVSSTKVRQALADNQSLDGLVSLPVARYLTRLKLDK